MSQGPAVVRAALGAWLSPRRTRPALVRHQDALLRRLLQHAYATVSYYRTSWDRAGISPDRIRGIADLPLLPFSSKADLRQYPLEAVTSSRYDAAKLMTAFTSGSSGVPFAIRRTWLESALQYLYRIRSSAHFGRFFGRVALVGVDWPDDPQDPKLGERLLGALGIDRMHGIDGLDAPENIVRELRAARPHIIIAMPGILGRAADYINQHGIQDIRPRVVIVGGEVLTRPLRARLEQAFGPCVFEHYGSHEFPLMAWQCRQGGGMHVVDDGVILEVLRDDGQPAEPGERGEVVVTNLHAYAMPFIRYRIGDIATRGEAPCSCGQPFSTIRGIEGRVLDSFPLPDGRVVHPYEFLMLMPGGWDRWIMQYQLLQERRDRIEFRYVATAQSAAADVAQFERAARQFVGPAVTFDVVQVDDLPLDATGKFRSARSLVAATESV